jgi:hypothetical protein
MEIYLFIDGTFPFRIWNLKKYRQPMFHMATTTLPHSSSLQSSTAKPSRISEQIIIFVKTALASGAAEKLDVRDRRFLAYVVNNPHKTLQELASFAGIRTRQGAHRIWKTGLHALWLASPAEVQDRYPIAELTGRKRSRFGRRGPPSPEEGVSQLWIC